MTKQPFSLSEFVITLLAASAFILSLAIFYGTKTGINDQAHLYDTLNAKSQNNNEKVDEINNDKVPQLNGLNNEMNQFMIYEFKNIYRVKA